MTKTKVDMAERWANVKIRDEMHSMPNEIKLSQVEFNFIMETLRRDDHNQILILPATPIDRGEVEIQLPLPDADQHAV